MDTATLIYRISSEFPQSEMFGLTAQMRRSAVPVASNIAEGYGRQQRKTFIQYLWIAQGSSKELETHSELARRVNLPEQDAAADVASRCEVLGKMLRSLIRKLEVNKDRWMS